MTKFDCSEVRDLIHAFVDEELSAEERQAVAAHISGCRECGQALAELQRLRKSLAAAGNFPVPQHVEARARVAIGLAAGNEHRWSRRSVMALATSHLLVAAVAAGGAAWLLNQADRSDRLVRELVAVHVRASFADAPVQIASSDQHTVRPWYNGRIDYSPPVRDFTGDGYPLTGGRVDYVLGQNAATLVYGRRKHRISVLIAPEQRSSSLAASAGLSAARDGYNIAVWQADGFVFAAISDLNRSEMDQLMDLMLRRP